MSRRRTLNKYGLGEFDYEFMYDRQEGSCAICGYRPSENLSIDHDHKTGAVRELLCTRCNLGLGLFKEDVEVLKQAISYIEKHNGA